MALQPSSLVDAVWRHPIIFGSLLLLLTPSLFDLFLYFSPLLISTTLFIVALISMGPRFEETQAEREQWATNKGDSSSEETSSSWDLRHGPLSTPIDPPSGDQSPFSIASIVNLLRPHDSDAWIARFEELKARLLVWIDDMLKSAAAPRDSSPSLVANVFSSEDDSTHPRKEEQEHEKDVLPHPAVDIPGDNPSTPSVAVKDVPSAPFIAVKDVPSGDTPSGAVVSEFPKIPEPVWDIPTTPPSQEQDVDMPELEIVDAATLDCDSVGISKILRDTPVASSSILLDDDDLIKVNEEHMPEVQEHILEVEQHIPEATDVEQHIPEATKASPAVSPTKKVHFDSSPQPCEVQTRLVKEMQAKLSELDAKRRNKYVEVLSRRKQNKKLSPTSD